MPWTTLPAPFTVASRMDTLIAALIEAARRDAEHLHLLLVGCCWGLTDINALGQQA